MNVYEEISSFYQSFAGPKRVVGKSVGGRNIYALHIGAKSGPQVISQYAIHGREWVTGLLALYHVRRGVSRGGVWVLPLTNPDGALLSEVGSSSVPAGTDFFGAAADLPRWKANLAGVDLNVNFCARWGTGTQNLRRPSFANYIGPRPFSEPETIALRDFTLEVMPAATVSWHTKGEEIYWEFHQPSARRRRDKKLAKVLSASTGYPLVTVTGSAGGYKDWCIEALKIPAFTVEVGPDALTHPLGREALPALAARTLDALADLTDALCKGAL